ncbi:ribonuclease H-like domain-containing protein [Xylariaceae sp. AK1471]|nr:ribonuclease H-like domain-containing protein [Xylariaceae sp. AK1471]
MPINIIKDSRVWGCSDCSRVFPQKGLRNAHAFSTGHMSDRSCLECRMIFYTSDGLSQHMALNKNHIPETTMTDNIRGKALGSRPVPVSSPETTEPHLTSESGISVMSHPNLSHFSTNYWRQRDQLETALQGRPTHGYAWASPALSESIRPLLIFELLNNDRRRSEGFPTIHSLSNNQYGQRNDIISHSQPNHGDDRRDMPLPVPPPNLFHTGRKKYAALVIDCEMVELKDRVSDLVRISVVDFVTGAVVLNNLVQPVGHVKDWRARFSGVTPGILRAAKQDPDTAVLQGWPEARQKIFTLADSDTVLMGHALSNDLKILRIAADRVVDSVVLTAEAAFGRNTKRFPRKWSLKSACKELMDVDIQMSKNAGHDPLEDALATRELTLWCLTHPAELVAWGQNVRTEYERVAKERLERQKAEAAKRAEEKRRLGESLVEVEVDEKVDETAQSMDIHPFFI